VPERPDLAWQVPILRAEVCGRRLDGWRVKKPAVVRAVLRGSVEEEVVGSTVTDVRRHGHFICFDLDREVDLVVHPMLAGRFTVVEGQPKDRRELALALPLDDGRELRYRDSKTMGKVYVVPKGKAAAAIPNFAVGPDVLAQDFTFAAFRAIAKKRRDQAKIFLLDKAALDSFGNAYADETLFAAGVHPKAMVRSLSDEQLKDLYEAIRLVLSEAIAEVASRRPPLDEKVRDFLKVRNRKGEPCPTCGAPVRVCGVRGHDAYFCAHCQPDGRSTGQVDWRRLR